MALTRKMLKAMGIEEEKIDQIVEAHTETVEALKNEREELKQKASDFEKVQKELDELKSAAQSGEDWKGKFEKLSAEVESGKRQSAAAEAYKKLLKDSGVDARRIDTVMRADKDVISGLELDKNGGIVGEDKISEKIKSEWADFIAKDIELKTAPDTPPEQIKTKMSKAEIMKIKDTSERQKAIAENPEAFGYSAI